MGIENPAEIIVAPLGGMSAVKGSRWAHAAWRSMAQALDDPSRFRLLQSMYHTGVDASEGTHDKDACCDFYIVGMDLDEACWFARQHGIANWTRNPAQGDWGWHNHGFPIPPRWQFFTEVGIYVPGQLEDYRNHALGLSGFHVPNSDPQRYPADQFIFNYDKWLQEQDMDLNDQIGPENTVRDALRAAVAANKKLNALLGAASKNADRFRAMFDELDKIQTQNMDDATKQQIGNLRESAKKNREAVMSEIAALASQMEVDPAQN